MTSRRFDPIHVIERVYDLQCSDREWVTGLVEALAPGLNAGIGVSGCLWRLPQGSTHLVDPFDVSTTPELLELAPTIYGLVRGAAPRFYRQAPFFGLSSDLAPSDPIVARILRDCSRQLDQDFRDIVGLAVGDGFDTGISFTSFAVSVAPRHPSIHKKRMNRVALHIGAGLRLRERMRRGLVGDPDAILDQKGNVLHAEGDARSSDTRNALTHAVRLATKARGKMRTADGLEALSLWQALVEGRWTVVDWVDHDGRRFLVTYENPVHTGDCRTLTRRECDVAAFLVFGRSNSEIAYALGLNEGTVNRIARSVLRKLGHARRSDLASFFGGQDLAIHTWADEQGLRIVERKRADGLLAELSKAEREVVESVLRGASNAQIARARGRSASTVANQLASVYARFGVRGRVELAALLGTRGAGSGGSIAH